MAKISVIIPAHNREALIGQTISSLLNQTLPADEIIVVDDGSTDSTAQAAESEFSVFSRQLAGNARIPEFKVIRQENAGPGAARNRGFAESRGEFIHFFDSDDIAAPNKHEVQVQALQQSGADIAYGPWVKGYIREQNRGLARWPLGKAGSRERGVESGEARGKRYSFEPEGHVLQQKGLPKGELVKELLTRWSIVPQTCLFRRTILEKAGGFPNDLFVAEDQLVFLRCLLAGAKVVHTPGTLTFYRLGHSGKLTESAASRSRRFKDWLAFLCRAREECMAQKINPARWLGFDRRIWAAERDFATLAGQAPLPGYSCPRGGVRSFFFPLHKKAEQWLGGAKIRLTGNRQNTSFRTAPMSADQYALFPAAD